MNTVPKKIAVLLPAAYGGGTQRAAISLTAQIHDGARAAGDAIVVEFGYVDSKAASDPAIFNSLKVRGINFRPMVLKSVPSSQFVSTQLTARSRSKVYDPHTIVFDDGVSNFDDADFRVFVSDRLTGGRVAPTSPYSIVIFDFIQRYVPAVFNRDSDAASAHMWRAITAIMSNLVDAESIFVTTEQAASDAVGFGGARKVQVCKLPLSFDPVLPEDPPPARLSSELERRGHIIWTTNITPHKNHRVILRGLGDFYASNKNLPITLVTGVQTENFDPKNTVEPIADVPYVHEIRNIIANSSALAQNIIFKGDLSNFDYIQHLRQARVLLHGAIFDNGTFAIAEAAWHSVPSVSSRYNAIDEMSRKFELPLTYFDSDSSASMAHALRQALHELEDLKGKLPSRAKLTKFSSDALADDVWSIIRATMERSSVIQKCKK